MTTGVKVENHEPDWHIADVVLRFTIHQERPMQSRSLDIPEVSLVGWARTTKPVALPSLSTWRLKSPSVSEADPINDAMFGGSVLALLVVLVAAAVTA